MKTNNIYIGIDLATTYCVVAAYDAHIGQISIIQNTDDAVNNLPATIYFENENNLVVGKAAKEELQVSPELVAQLFKPHMGDPSFSREFHGKKYSAIELSAILLKKMSQFIQNEYDSKFDKKVVITCPAAYGYTEIEAVKQAGHIAGLEVVEVIKEPTAAALAYGVQRSNKDEVIIVYDFGGGTLDVSLIKVTHKNQNINFQVVDVDGDKNLGGKDIDAAIQTWLLQQIITESEASGDEILADISLMTELVTKSEDIKKSLSSKQHTKVIFKVDGQIVRLELTRKKFEELAAPFIDRTIAFTESVINRQAENGIHPTSIKLTGGSSEIPLVTKSLKKKFPNIDIQKNDPHLAVARGAAIYHYSIHHNDATIVFDSTQTSPSNNNQAQKYGISTMPNISVKDITSKTFGIEILNKDQKMIVDNLIMIRSTVPTKIIKKTYYLAYENQSQIEANIYESNDESKTSEIIECKAIGILSLNLKKSLPKSTPIEVSFELRNDGSLKITAFEKMTDSQVEVIIDMGEALLSQESLDTAKQSLAAMSLTH